MGKLSALLCFLILSLNLTSCSSVSPGSARQPSPYIQKLGSETVALVYEISPNNTHVFCTGVWVGSNAILTAAHCVDGVMGKMNEDKAEDAPDFQEIGLPIHFIQENETMGMDEEPSAVHLSKVSFMDVDHDLALLHAEGRAIPPHAIAELAVVNPAIGDKIHIVGHTIGLYWTYLEGTVSAYRETMPSDFVSKTGPFTQVNASIEHGNSGGGCFDLDGKLIGIVSFMAPIPSTSFLIGLSSLQHFLHDHLHS